jgi:hypothetical protein
MPLPIELYQGGGFFDACDGPKKSNKKSPFRALLRGYVIGGLFLVSLGTQLASPFNREFWSYTKLCYGYLFIILM